MGFELLAPSGSKVNWRIIVLLLGSLFCNTQLRLIHGKFRGRGGELKWEGNAWSFLLLLLSLICPVSNRNESCMFSGATHVIAFFACGPCVQFSTGLDRSYALFFKLSLSTFLFLLFLNAFFTACNYRVVMFLRHFTPKKRFPVLPVYCLYPDISQLWKTKNLVACLFKWVMNKELLVSKLWLFDRVKFLDKNFKIC